MSEKCAEIVCCRDHAISFNYFVYKYIEIVRIVKDYSKL